MQFLKDGLSGRITRLIVWSVLPIGLIVTFCFGQLSGGWVTKSCADVWLILLSGTVSTLLLRALINFLLNTHSEAQKLAKVMTADLLKSEEALRQVTERLSLAARAGGVGIWDYDVISNHLVWDAQMFRLYGITPEQFSGAYEAWQAGVHPEDRKWGDERIQLALRGEKEFDIEFRIVWPDGSIRYIRGFAMVQRDDAGNPLRMIGTNWDITSQKRADEALRESESNFRTFFESMTDMIMAGTPKGSILFANSAVTRTLGYTPEELKGMHLLDLHPTDKRQEAETILIAMFKGEQESCSLPLMSKTGVLVPVEIRVWFGTWNGEHCLFCICKNVRAEQEARQRLTLERDAAQAAALAKSLFVSNMSHEIRTPLNVILGYVQIMERECQACPVKPRLKAITRSGEHLLELLTDLLELVRGDAHTIRLASKTFDFYQALEDVRLMFVRHPESQGLTLEFTYLSNVPRLIHADSEKIRQILVNLVGNAVKFTEKGSVCVSASVLGGTMPAGDFMIAIDVKDTGCGIGEDDLNRIFDVFEQAESGWEGGKGTGLGLFMSQRYARALGGDITVMSQLGEGSCFRFTFRARIASEETNGQSLTGNGLRLFKNQRALRLLVVDDDPLNRDMLVIMLEPAGFVVETATCAEQALCRIRQTEAFDLILMDKRMPDMDGYEAIAQIRKLPSGRVPPVVMVTASGFADEGIPAFAAGANGYISKPVQREQLLMEIARVCGIQYDDGQKQQMGSSLAMPAGLDAQAMAQIPEEQRRLLSQALCLGDILALRKIVETIAQHHAELAAHICELVDSYNYDSLQGLLDSAKGTTE